jgi:hypothetical protein
MKRSASRVSRREFLLLRGPGVDRTAVLSCERLYMHYVDTQLSGQAPASIDGVDQEWPSTLTADALFDQLERSLQSATAVRVIDGGWLSHEDFRQRIEPVLARFEARGGRVIMTSRAATPSNT